MQDRITLPASDRSIHVAFALSNIFDAIHHQYTYQLQGRDHNWRNIGNQHELAFDDLPAGDYILRIKGIDAHGNPTGNELSIPFLAKAFFYEQWWFYVLCFGFIVSLSVLWISRLRSEVNRATSTIRADKEIIEQQADQLKELDKAKSKFFTNISHEFRTPLTIVSGMAAQILENPGIWAIKGAEMIRNNSNSLLHLVNQILDLRKLQSSELKLQLVQGDIVAYISYLVESFKSYATREGKALHFQSLATRCIMDYDPDKIMRIISNLIANAIKYTETGTDIHVRVAVEQQDQQEWLTMRIEDNGPGIEEDKLPLLFNRFFQGDTSGAHMEGSGIGLALVKELVLLMHGHINVESTLGAGTQFIIQLPVTRDAQMTFDDIPRPIPPNDIAVTTAISDSLEPMLEIDEKESVERPTVLVVEDHPDVRQFIVSCLQSEYTLLLASDGKAGVELAFEEVPDLIVSDVMMPEMDGFELCALLKNDPRTDHIPIVLLTAKADMESKLSGLKRGADDYLIKPFEPRELRVRLENLLSSRKILQERYASGVIAKSQDDTPQDAFVADLYQAILKHLDDEDFGVLQLGREMGLGRSQLHNKIKALTGMPTSIFIRHVRLTKARELLQQGDLNVSEVSYAVGFSDPKYFSRVYTEKFNEPPSRTSK